ncbi:hypothetical protein M0813_04118 [Anaeramoeba flamelloides]|uniref:BZIP domain-containing protein n=1 Tax=Anaeramoeba flamelloides TaxID=1746091 RepID=A0ABQ8XPQ1_9EUKA|nr:hypothetical protein M0813_04118 [Anaeramoeba flamelloides]
MDKERKFKAKIVFESNETRVLRNQIRLQEEQEEVVEKNTQEWENERKRRRQISNQKKVRRYREKNKRIAFSNEIADRFQTLRKNTQKTNSQFLQILLDYYEQNENKKKKKNNKNFIKMKNNIIFISVAFKKK